MLRSLCKSQQLRTHTKLVIFASNVKRGLMDIKSGKVSMKSYEAKSNVVKKRFRIIF